VLYFTHLAGCGVDLPGMREVADDPRRVDELGPSVLTARLAVSAVLALLLAGGALLFLPQPEAGVLALYALTLLSVGPNPRWIQLGLSRPRSVAIARTAGEATFLALVLLLVREPADIAAVPWAQFLGDALATAVLLVWLRRQGVALPLRVDWERVKPLFRRSFPLVLNILLGLLIFNSDLIFLWLFREPATVGWYTASYQLISFLINIAWAYSHTLLPALTQAARVPGERERLYASSVAQAFAVGLPVAAGGALVAPQIIALVFGAQYEPAALPLAILLGTVPFMLFKDVGTVALIVSGREGTVMRMTAAAMVLNVLLNALVIPRYGMVGAACTTLATEVFRAALAVVCVRAQGWPAVPPSRLWRSAVAASAMVAALVVMAPLSLWLALALGAATYTAALALTGGIRFAGGLPALRV
jgi:O-antigen/teichoic acid export membrane protein